MDHVPWPRRDGVPQRDEFDCQLVVVPRSADHRARSPTSMANARMSVSMLALSRAESYASRSSTLMTVQGYPPDASIAFMTNRDIRPLPSGYGWM